MSQTFESLVVKEKAYVILVFVIKKKMKQLNYVCVELQYFLNMQQNKTVEFINRMRHICVFHCL